jgi:hypothetical protein
LIEDAQRIASPVRLDEAADELTGLVSTADNDADLAVALSMQAVVLLTRHAWAGDIRDLHRAVAIGLRATSCCAADRPNAAREHRSPALANLANILRSRFEVLGDIGDLSAAITLGREALSAQLADATQERRILSNLSLCLRIRCQVGGSLNDIDEAITLGERAAALTPSGQPERAAVLSNLGGAYQVKHERSGDMGALGRAIECGREALWSSAPDDPFRASILSNLGSVLQIRAERLGHSQDITEAIRMARAAVAATPADDRGRIPRLANLATAYLTQFDHDGDLADLDEAVDAATRALNETNPADPALAGRASNLSAALRTRFERTHKKQDLDGALSAARQAVAAAGGDRAVRTAYLSSLGTALRASYQLAQQACDVREAEGVFRAALEALPVDDPDRAALLSNLGATLYEHYEREPDPDLASQAEDAFRMASGVVTARPRVRVATSTSWGRIAAERGRWGSADEGLSLAVGLLGSLVPAELDQEDQQRELRRHFALAADAAACALETGDAARALVLLEMGRGLLLRQAIDARADLGVLARQAPELARRFAGLRKELDLDDGRSTADSRRRRFAELENTLALIRQVPRFSDFLRMPRIADLLPLAERGPIVVLNVSELRSDALILRTDGVSRCSLPGVSPGQVQAQAAALLSADDLRQQGGSAAEQAAADEGVTAILAWLWEAITEPVLAALGLLSAAPPDGQWPRVWWVPTGLLSFLPMHAAQGMDGGCVLDRVISSFAPTLHALGFARRASSSGQPRMLAVAAPSLPGVAELPAARREAMAIAELMPCPVDLLSGTEATREAVLGALNSHSWAHFACHATTDLLLPSRGALMVHGADTEPLTVADVARLDLTHAELAFLSACTTTRSVPDLTDESIHLTSAFQLAGYRHVVGTLWPVSDPVALRAASAFYGQVAVPGALRGERSAAAAHHASRLLRRRFPRQPSCWAAHIHAGA